MAKHTGPTPAVVAAIRERDGWACVRCGDRGRLTTQHRISRGMGGTRDPAINRPCNLITLCGSGTTGCHGWVEGHPEAAQIYGWAVPRTEDPATVPVWTWQGWMLLEEDYATPLTTGLQCTP